MLKLERRGLFVGQGREMVVAEDEKSENDINGECLSCWFEREDVQWPCSAISSPCTPYHLVTVLFVSTRYV